MATYDIRYDISTQEYEGILEGIKRIPIENDDLKCANFGCGPMIWHNWRSYDKYYQHPLVVNVDMCDETLKSDNLDVVFSSHSLEHNYFHLAKKTVLNWKRILKVGGAIHMAIPDLENTMKIMLDERTTYEQKYGWYIYTMFGYQVSPDIPWNQRTLDDKVDPGQIHFCGFTKEWVNRFFMENGFSIEKLVSYDGYGTPSLYLIARKL